MEEMKKKWFSKFIIGLTCSSCILFGTAIYASMQKEKGTEEKLNKIAEYDQEIEQLQTGNTIQDKEELKNVLDEKLQLEIETDTYDYNKELETSINSVYTAVEDMKLFYAAEPDKLTKSEEKRINLLKQLCEEYTEKLCSGHKGVDDKELLDQFRQKMDAINLKYR
jgi:hypothetical protein